MAGKYIWMASTDDALAPQLTNFATQLAPLASSLGVSTADLDTLTNSAAAFAYLQLQLIPAVRGFSTSVTSARDLLEVDATQETFVFPVPNFPIAPNTPVQTNFLPWTDTLIKNIQLSPNYNEQVGHTLGIIPATPAPPPSKPAIRKTETLPGGLIEVEVQRGGHALIILEMEVDGANFSQAAMLPSAKFELKVPPGAPHHVKLRARYAETNGTPTGDYSAEVSVVSQP